MKLKKNMVCCFVVRPGLPQGEGVGRHKPGPHEFLQLCRATNDALRGTWHTVYGGIKPKRKETAVKAALRELREETGLIPTEFYRLGMTSNFYLPEQDTIWIVPCFCAFVGRADAVHINDESSDYRWVPRARVDTDFLWPTDRAVLAHLCHDLLDNSDAKPYLRLPL